MFQNYEFRQLRLNLPQHYETVKSFLADNGLSFEKMDYYVGIFSDETMLAGGGAYNNIIKCVAVSSQHREMNLAGPLITHLHNYVRSRGYSNTFLFTKREYEKVFSSLAFYPVGHSPDAVLLESRYDGISSYCADISKYAVEGNNACIVMNCNPFTLGHLYLIETAASMTDRLHIFVLKEEQDFMPAIDRYNLVKRGTEHLNNVNVMQGSEYIISQATFPSYFIKDASLVARNQIHLDLDVFTNHIAPALKIKRRFVGEEPTDAATRQYNEVMSTLLPQKGIEFTVIPRKQHTGLPISASRVRALFKEGRMDEIASLVPSVTYRYLEEKIKQ